MAGAESDPLVLEFGRFTLDRRRRELRADGRPVALGTRTFDTLLALVDAHGTVLSKDELMRRVWADRVVEENNLEIQISALRKALGTERSLIRTVPTRGYQFTGDIRAVTAAASAASLVNIPVPVSQLIGRQSDIGDVQALLMTHRLVTLAGVGGIGKTRLGGEAARRVAPAFPDGVFLADLAPLSSPTVVPVTVAARMNLDLVGDAVSPERIGAAIGTRRMLLMLDNCEHLVEAAADLAQRLLRSSAGLTILCTSREPLRADGEYVYRVLPLAVPGEDAGAEELLQSDAVKLLVTRARAAGPAFVADHHVAATLASICRRLDGLPLAIELAAARIASLGPDGIAARLNDRFTLLTSGSRTAMPRHQTLRATLDWSYELLSPHERLVLRRLTVFAGAFTLDAATEVVSGAGVSIADVEDAMANLVAKSLVGAEVGAVTHYRLLETMRVYALEKLRETGEFDRFARRHAEYHEHICEGTEVAWAGSPPPDWVAVYGRQIDNVRLALDWAFSPSGDPGVGVALTVAAIPLWTHLALVTECRTRVEQAIAHVEGLPADDARDMRLFQALGNSLLHLPLVASGPIVSALTRALKLAEGLDDAEYRLRAIYGLYVLRLILRDHRGALELGETIRALAASMPDPTEELIARRFVGSVLHVMGDQRAARRHVEPLVEADLGATRPAYILRYQWDQRVVAHGYYARILWLQGFVERARRIGDEIVDYAEAAGHLASLLFALTQACPVALSVGDLNAVDGFRRRTADLASKLGLESWRRWAQCVEGSVLIKRGDNSAGATLMRRALDALPEAASHFHTNLFRSELASGLGAAGQMSEAIAMIDSTIARARSAEEGWCLPELLRKKGELLVQTDEAKLAPEATMYFRQAIDVAHGQDALWWELRSTTSLAGLYQREGLTAEARNLLAPVYRRFTEGLNTPDLVAAKALLDQLR
jgi:predicted ATPase/DNA-binding winged helix-turn-helix (wHTH) protein